LIEGDVANAVAELKDRPGGNIAVLGSGDLVQTLIEGGLVDAYSLTVNPIALGGGKRLFRDPENSTRLKLVDSQTTSKGSLLLTYEPE
jgi:dihydrofolate reductase